MFCTLLAKTTTKQINVISHSWIVYPENGRDSWSRKKSNEEGNRLIKSNQDFTGFYNNTLQHKLPLSFCDIVSARSSMMTTSESVPAALFTVAESSVKKNKPPNSVQLFGNWPQNNHAHKTWWQSLKKQISKKLHPKKSQGFIASQTTYPHSHQWINW